MTRKLLALGLCLAWFPSFVHAKGARQTFKTYDFSKGVDTYHNPTTLPDGFSQNSLNVLFDAKAPVSKVPGFAVAWSTKSYSYTSLWTYTDQTNTTWQLARSSDQITANNLAGSIVLVATVAPSNLVGETNAFGYAYFVDQTQGLYYWNGTSTTFVGASPKGSIITQFHNRLWITGAAVPNGNQLYGSGYYAGNTWTTGLNDTDPVQYSIGLQDNFDNVTAEYVYLDTLYLFKHYSIFALYGFGQSSFQISQLIQECGCIDGATIQTYNGGLKFVSLRGVEDFNGYSCTRISDSVKNLVDPAIQSGGFSQQSWVQQTNTDFSAGSANPTFTDSTTFTNAVRLENYQESFVSTSPWTIVSGNFTLGSGYFSTSFSNGNEMYLTSPFPVSPSSFMLHIGFSYTDHTANNNIGIAWSNGSYGYAIEKLDSSVHEVAMGSFQFPHQLNEIPLGGGEYPSTISDESPHTMDLIYSSTGYARGYFD